MNQLAKIPFVSDNDEYAIRSENWISELTDLQKPRRLRERNPNPLILTGHGNSLRIENGTLVIKQGFSHYPQKQECHRYFKGDLELPRIILLLDGSGTISFDVLSWLGEQNVALARMNWAGEIAIAISGNGYANDPEKVDWQREMRNCPKKQIEFAREIISQKLANSVKTLEKEIPSSELQAKAIARAKRGISELSESLADMQQVRAIEGECASAYFKAWTQLQLNWKSNSRYPLPEQWKSYRARSAVRDQAPKNCNATDPINAMLNYAYAVKTTQLQIDAIGQGYDPTIGIMHHGRRGKPAYILDILEPERPKVDAAILRFLRMTTFSGADFILRKDGTCRLSPQLARVVIAAIDS